jgi:hypothetical protein
VKFATEEARQQAIQEFIEGTYVEEQGVAAVLAACAQSTAVAATCHTAAAQAQLSQLVQHALPAVAALESAVPSQEELSFPEATGAGSGELDWDVSGTKGLVQLRAEQWQNWAAAVVRQLLAKQGCPAVTPPAEGVLRAATVGVTLVELFGGMCAGLEACLKCGWRVHRYIYVDKDPEVRKVAAYRLATLQSQYPDQLSREACRGASLPGLKMCEKCRSVSCKTSVSKATLSSFGQGGSVRI